MNSKPISIILTDDHQVVRDGLKSMLSEYRDIQILGTADSGAALMELLSHMKADVLVLDIELPDISGLDLCQKVLSKYPAIRILILSMYTGEEFIFKALAEGAKGYLPKNTTREELAEAIRALAEGKEFFSPLINEIMLKSYINQAKSKRVEEKELADLSKRETEILRMMAEGIPNIEIADRLFISIRTVESHKSHIMQKLDLHTTAELVKYAIRHKLIEI
ncbi:MAG: response regulator transcription factor [Bacteroidales bacterium]|nr:response regulator transcription factor [Bacteroidales bacterium]